MSTSRDITPLEKDQLSITTATIAIKVITVNNRKMTLSVFRQLPEVCPWSDTFPPRLKDGIEPWGYVRYDFDIFKGGKHILFTYKGELCRWYDQDVIVNVPKGGTRCAHSFLPYDATRLQSDLLELASSFYDSASNLYDYRFGSVHNVYNRHESILAKNFEWRLTETTFWGIPLRYIDLETGQVKVSGYATSQFPAGVLTDIRNYVLRIERLRDHQKARLEKLLAQAEKVEKAETARLSKERAECIRSGRDFLLKDRAQIFIAV